MFSRFRCCSDIHSRSSLHSCSLIYSTRLRYLSVQTLSLTYLLAVLPHPQSISFHSKRSYRMSANEWACPACTYVNTNKTKCAMCSTFLAILVVLVALTAMLFVVLIQMVITLHNLQWSL